MDTTHDIDYYLDEVVTLPSLPSTVAHITELVNDPNCPLSAVGRAISADPSITLKSLRLVNSAYYGLRQKVTSVDHAVVLLGMKVMKNLVFTATVFDTMQSGEEASLRHSVMCGVTMRILAESGKVRGLGIEEPEEAFIFGLLHDVGKIIFHQFMPKEYGLVAEASTARGITWAEAEREIIGTDHAEMGARLAQKWKLDDILADAIGGHHDLGRCAAAAHRPMAALLTVADYICYAAGCPGQGEVPPKVAPEVWETTGLTNRTLIPVLATLFESTGDIEELISMAA